LKFLSADPRGDGIEADFLEFNSGITATISVADKAGQLVHWHGDGKNTSPRRIWIVRGWR
jgi:hypothetical protein